MNRFLCRTAALGHLLLLSAVVLAADAPKEQGKKAEWVDAGTGAQQIEADWLHADSLREKPGVAVNQGGGSVKPEEDAAGGVDGVKDGKWGFHTENEDNPWWQVDLGKATALDRVVLYNRCDDCGGRNVRIMVLLSDDAKAFKQAYQHDGTPFSGYSDKKPLSVAMKGASARYVRLALSGKSYFHLDEVEVYAAGSQENIAKGKPATQSSVSPWSVAHGKAQSSAPAAVAAGPYYTGKAIERGLKLAENLRGQDVDVSAEVKTLQEAAEKLKQLPANAPDETQRKLYMDVRWAVRKMALRNPLLDFDTVLFVKGAPGRFPHMSDQYYGWWSRPGGGVYLLQGIKGDTPKLKCLTADFAPGSFIRPELSYDGTKILFAYCKFYEHVANLRDKASKVHVPEDAFYHLFEMNLDGTGCRQLTKGRYDDFDGRYLPSGDIVFTSTRKGVALQVCKASAAATEKADMPDSYVRCGGDQYRPVPVFTLHAINADGQNLRPISAFENFEWMPTVSNDGRLIYTRWDYIDRFNGHFFSLWSTNPDGTNSQLVYGNYTVRPQVKTDIRAIPGSSRFVFTASAHHSITGGSLVLLDRSRGLEGPEPITRLTPEVAFPETEALGNMYYANPWPLSEEHFLVAWSDRKLPPHCRVDDTNQNPVNATGLYLYDAFGNLNLLYRDPELSSAAPVALKARPKPPVLADTVAWDGPQEGRFLLQDVYQGLPGIERGTVKRLRIVGVPSKVQPNMNSPNLGVSAEDPGKYVLGTVPVEEDGSAFFRAPSGIPVFFQAMDDKGLALQTMRSLTYVQPGQTLSCVGCHEPREAAPQVPGRRAVAASREPSKITPGPEGSWPLRFDQLVQPVLDKHCVSCHAPGNSNAKAAALDLTKAKAYQNLLNFGGKNLQQLAFEKDRSIVGDCPAKKSKLLASLPWGDPATKPTIKDHENIKLDADSFDRLVTWMDVYAQQRGHYSDKQEAELRELKEKLAALLTK
ncbi:MAG: discoidin domain-containing protein [Planctomycetota bacterium]|nr:discoidin domain-containing protein [Planctomycetota bacterium]